MPDIFVEEYSGVPRSLSFQLFCIEYGWRVTKDERIAARRKELGVPQIDLARLAGISQPTVA